LILVAAGIIEKNGLVFAARRGEGRHLAGHWEFPGGKIEEHESPKQCLIRELKEEFGVETSVGSFVAESIHNYDGETIKLLAYQVTHDKGDFKLVDHDKVVWLRPNELGSLNWAAADVPIVEKYQTMLLKVLSQG